MGTVELWGAPKLPHNYGNTGKGLSDVTVFSRKFSGAAINSAKRRIDLNTPVINRNGRIEEAGETDDDGRLVDEGGEDDFDAVNDSVKSNVKEPKEINLVAQIPSPRPSKVSKNLERFSIKSTFHPIILIISIHFKSSFFDR
jgi:hypothetical protein